MASIFWVAEAGPNFFVSEISSKMPERRNLITRISNRYEMVTQINFFAPLDFVGVSKSAGVPVSKHWTKVIATPDSTVIKG